MAKGRGLMGGNRAGKTVCGATEMIMWLTGKHPYRPTPPPPIQARGVSVDFDHGFELIMKPEIARWMPPSELIDGSWEKSFQKSTRMLTLANGSTMEFLSYDQDVDKHAGTSRHIIWFDEEPPKEIFNENMARLIDISGSWILTMTPLDGMTWVYDDIYLPSKLNPDPYVIEVGMDSNIYINTNEIDSYLAGMTEEEKQARRHGKFVQIGGLIYGRYLKEGANVIQPILGTERWETVRTKWTHFLAMDHGFNNPTCFLWIAADSDGRLLIYDEYYVSGEIVSYHASQIRERCQVLGVDPTFIVGDPSIRNTDPITGTSVQIEYVECGLSIALGNNNVPGGINRVARLLESNQLMIARNCEKLLWEMQRYRWGRWSSRKIEATNNIKEVPVKKDDHACDALRYGVASRFSADEVSLPEPKNLLGSSEALVLDSPRYGVDLDLTRLQDYGAKDVNSMLGDDW
jgi:phage terminase large subunit-like protein